MSATNLHAQTLPEGYELHPLGGGLDNRVEAVHAVGNDIYYGGSFTQAFNALDGTAPTDPVANTRYIARWDGSQWHPLGRGTNSDVRAIASANDGSIYVGGLFTQVTQADGSTLNVNRIARFKNGQWSAVGSGVRSSLIAMAVVERPEGGHDLYVGGDFATATDSSGAKTVNHLAKWDGSQWQALGAGVDNSVNSIVYSKARGGLYIGSWFNNANAFGGGSAVILNRVGYWNIAEQQWQPMASGTTGYSPSTFQEMADGHSVFVSGFGVGIKRFDWASSSWTTLNTADTFGMQLLPDQQRLISLGDSTNSGLQLWDISAASPTSHQLTDFYSKYFVQNTATHHSGVYLGFGNIVDQYRYAARLVVPDMDGDEIANDDDNCPLHANNDQLDTDLDSAGDVCDICPADALDNCLENPNGDFDSDGVNNTDDICPVDILNNCLDNPNGDFDGDGFNNSVDVFPTDPTEWADTDGDSIGNNIDPDIDGDNVLNSEDNCVDVHNPDQLDLNNNGVGDICEGVMFSKLSCVLKTHTGVRDVNRLNLSPDARTLYIGAASATHDKVSRIDTRTQQRLSDYSAELTPWDVVASADGQWVYSANGNGNTVSAINLVDGALSQTFSGFRSPRALALSEDQRYLFVANFFGAGISVIDRQTHTLLSNSIATNNYVTKALAVSGNRLYATHSFDDRLSIIDISSADPSHWQLIDTPMVVEGAPGSIAIDKSGFAYIAASVANTVLVIDTYTQRIIATVSGIDSANNIRLTANGRYLYVAEFAGSRVSVIDTALARSNPAQAIIHRFTGVGSALGDVLLMPNERRAYMAARSSSEVRYLAINQLDVNSNGVGDDCEDMDGDSIIEGSDNCPGIANPDQLDSDQDGAGDACDAFNSDPAEWLDTDNDGTGDNADICPQDALNNCLANPAGDFDGDGFNNGSDAFPTDPTEWLDTDSDGVGDNKDNCGLVANSDQTDLDQNGVGDACDLDIDGDGVPNTDDDFPLDDSKWRDGDVAERLGDAAKQNFGQVIVNLGDINGDCADDYAIGTPKFKASTQVNGKTKLLNKAGKVEIISGKTSEVLLSQTGTSAKALFGSAVLAADFDRDGLVDIAIGSPGANKNTGEVEICLAHVDGGFNCAETITADASFKGSLFGTSLAAAEIDNSTQLFAGAPKAKNTDKKTVGAVVRFENNAFTNPETRYGTAINGEFGTALAWLPQSGLIAIGAPKANKTGEVALWDVLNDEFAAPLTGIAAKEGFGRKLAVGSLADGVEHLAVAAPLATNGTLKQAGRVDVFELAASNEPLKSYLGTSKSEQLGTSLAIDEQETLFAGSPNYTVPKTASSKALKKAGKVASFIFAANNAQDEKFGTQANQQFGASLAAIELTGDFKVDLLVGSIGANNPADKKLKAAGKLELINANDWQP